jgi:hypothetical protein
MTSPTQTPGQSQTTGDLREELRGDAQTVASTAKQRIHGEVDARKGDAATQVKSLSSALENAAGQLGNDSPSWLRSAFEQGAQSLQRFAETVEQKDSRQLTRDVTDLARQNPGTFLAGCALAGFAAARVFKAGAESGTQSTGGQYAGSSGNTDYNPSDYVSAGHASAFFGDSSGAAAQQQAPTVGGLS